MMDDRVYQLLIRLSFFAAEGMADAALVKLAREADELASEEAGRRGREQANGKG